VLKDDTHLMPATSSRSKPSATKAIDALRTRLWLDHALWKTGMTAHEFGRAYVERRSDRFQDSKAVFKWAALKRIPSRGRVLQIERSVPNTAWVHDLPLFDLFDSSPLTVARVERLTSSLRAGEPFGHDWHFPADPPFARAHTRWDTAGLVDRGDVWALIATLACVRYTETTHDVDAFVRALQDAYRILPGVLKTPWARLALPQFRNCLDIIRARAPSVARCFLVNWARIEAYRDWDGYVPLRHMRRRDAEGGRFIEYPDVVLPLPSQVSPCLPLSVIEALEEQLEIPEGRQPISSQRVRRGRAN